MTQSPTSQQSTKAVLDTPADTSRLATCPLCHTKHASLTQEALEAGGGWRCVRCGQRWDAHRLQAVAAYAVWVAEHEIVHRSHGTAVTRIATPFVGNAPVNESKPRGDAVSRWEDEGGSYLSTVERAVSNNDQAMSEPALCSSAFHP